MTRGVWKGPFVHPSLLKKIDKLKDQTRKPKRSDQFIISRRKKRNK